ncbi:Ig-like domain-containing protein [Arthrobacter sp. LAR12-1-1.1]|uniref:Ig-like domain-containing protein n=1 Tax=Arthrobacter sp. LAR12-1-1.1 TaxID=3135215 RepID=UPI003447D36B
MPVRTRGINPLQPAPADGSKLARTANITATFSEAVAGTSTGNHFDLRNATTNAMIPVEAFSYNAVTRVATLNPNDTLAANTKYTATLTNGLYGGILDAGGNPLQTTRWSFTTGP